MHAVIGRGRQRGAGLVELMVGIVISLIVLAGTIFVFIGNSESAIFHIRSTRFVQQMRDSMDRMVQDIRRTGYMGYLHATGAAPPANNPFSTYDPNETVLGTATTGVAAHGDCANGVCPAITYTYNVDQELNTSRTALLVQSPQIGQGGGTDCGADFDPAAANELFGFRVDKTDPAAWVLEMRTMQGTPVNCGDLRTGAWDRVTDPGVVLLTDLPDPSAPGGVFRTGFSMTEDCYGYVDQNSDGVGDCANRQSGDLAVWVRQVRIQLAGRSATDPEVTFKLSQVVDLPNYVSARVVP